MAIAMTKYFRDTFGRDQYQRGLAVGLCSRASSHPAPGPQRIKSPIKPINSNCLKGVQDVLIAIPSG